MTMMMKMATTPLFLGYCLALTALTACILLSSNSKSMVQAREFGDFFDESMYEDDNYTALQKLLKTVSIRLHIYIYIYSTSTST